MIFLAVAHLVAEYDGNLVFIRQNGKEPRIDAHIVSERAEGIETRFFIDEIIIWLVIDRWINGTDGCSQIGHDGIETIVEIRIVIDTILLFHLFKEFLTSFFGIVVPLEDLRELCMRCCALDARSDDAAPAKFGRCLWCRCNRIAAWYDETGGKSERQQFLLES